MKKNLKIVAILASLVLLCAFTGCKNSTNEDDGNSISKLDGATKAVLGYSTTNDSSQAIYDENINYATIESGANTRTVNFSSSEVYSGPYLVPVNGKKYYFWLKVTSAANNVRESAWSNVAEFTYTK